MLRVRVCAAHMGEFLGPKFSKPGSLLRQIFLKHEWVSRNWQKSVKISSFLPTFIINVGITAAVGN